jgi:predicted RNA-binding Zn ribbon-like protein
MDEAPSPQVQGPFELSGDEVCLDFVNTWADRARPETDGLRDYGQLLAFARQAGLVDPENEGRLAARAQAEVHAAAAAIATARRLREALYGIFSARARGREVQAPDLASLNRALQEALPNLRLDLQGTEFAWTWQQDRVPLTAPLWPLARAAADLLTSATGTRLRECDGARCTWLFLDFSRGRSRRWCSMASCGNRAKARRHYHRGRSQAAES